VAVGGYLGGFLFDLSGSYQPAWILSLVAIVTAFVSLDLAPRMHPQQRHSRSWVATIRNAREAICDIQADTPSLTDDRIRHRWDACLSNAHREAEGELNRGIPGTELSWGEVFEALYTFEGN
jgi:hypothetical protein